MSGAEPPELRISDADREEAVERLNAAVAEGRLTLSEFEQRVDQVLQARTASEVAPHLADLPGGTPAGTPGGTPAGATEARPAPAPAPERGELRSTMSSLKRTGRWVVPRRLAVQSKAGSVTLDFTEAVISHPVIHVELEVFAGATTLVLPRGASVDVDQVELGMIASSAKVHKVPRSSEPAGQPHVVVSGKQWAGSLVVRYQRRFLWSRW